MIKFIQALFSGLLVVLILDFFIFLGLYLHYVEALEIPFYFNAFFIDNQPWLLLFISTLLFGLLIIYNPIKMVNLAVLLLATSVSLLPLIPSIGLNSGYWLFSLEPYDITINQQHYHGKLLYKRRGIVTLFDNDLQRNVTLELPTAHP